VRALAIALTLAAVLASCASPPRVLRWEVVGGEERRAEVGEWTVWIEPGRCAWTGSRGGLDADTLDAGVAIYEERFTSPEAAPPPPELGPGMWAFHVVGRDAAGQIITAGCEHATLPLPREERVTVTLRAAYLAADGDLAELRFCEVWHESGCSDGDDDCDGLADCLDDACAAGAECTCASDADCGECRTCDPITDACVPRVLETPLLCDDGAGQCREGVCCTGCFANGVCHPGTSDAACGAGGADCNGDCPCGCAEGRCAECECSLLTRCSPGASCVEGRCCAGPPGEPDKVSVSVGHGYACVDDAAAGIRCFGEGSSGQLGLGRTEDGAGAVLCPGSSMRCMGIGDTWYDVRASHTHTCAVRYQTSSHPRRLACWGANTAGQLGAGGTAAAVTPQFLNYPSNVTLASVVDFDVGESFTCIVAPALLTVDAPTLDAGLAPDSNRLWCWGSYVAGRLGQGPGRTMNSGTPLLVRLAGTPQAVTLGAGHACSLTTEGELWCWGANDRGQVGTGRTSPAIESPEQVGPVGRIWTAVAAGDEHTCGAYRVPSGEHRVACWGANNAGQLGSAMATRVLVPLDVESLDDFSDVPGLALGAAHTCVLGREGLRCFGDRGTFGALDMEAGFDSGMLDAGTLDGGAVGSPVPINPVLPAEVVSVRSVSAGGRGTCIVDQSGIVHCAGDIDCTEPAGACSFHRVCLTP